jgi:hypothetical protein
MNPYRHRMELEIGTAPIHFETAMVGTVISWQLIDHTKTYMPPYHGSARGSQENKHQLSRLNTVHKCRVAGRLCNMIVLGRPFAYARNAAPLESRPAHIFNRSGRAISARLYGVGPPAA